MPQVSKYPLPKDVYDQIQDLFINSVVKLGNKRKVKDFFGHLLTPTEQVMLAKRLAISYLLAEKYDYRSISSLLRVSTTTVSKVAGIYKYNKDFRNYINRIIKEEQFEEFLLGIGEKLTSILSAGKSKSGAWIYLREEIKKKRRNKSI